MNTTENLEAGDQDRRLVGATASDAVHPFRVNFPDADLTALRRRISATIARRELDNTQEERPL